MEKRTERNKSLYSKVEKRITEIANKRSNKDYEKASKTLQTVDSAYFGNDEEETEEKSKNITTQKTNNKNKAILITVIIVLVAALIGILIMVVK